MELFYYWIAIITLIPLFFGPIITKIIDSLVVWDIEKQNKVHHFDEHKDYKEVQKELNGEFILDFFSKLAVKKY